LQGAAGAARNDGPGGESSAEGHTNLDPTVDGPAVGIEDGSERALAKFNPGNDHGRTRDDKNDPEKGGDDDQGTASENAGGVADESRREGAESTKSNAEGGDGANVHFFAARRVVFEFGYRDGGGGGVDGIGGGGGEFFIGLGFGSSSAFGDLLFDESDEFFVGTKESLPDADGVFDYRGDLGIPIQPLPIVENSVAPHKEIVAVALRETGGDFQGGVAEAGAFAIGDVGLAHGGERRGSRDLDAEFGGAAVEVKAAGLEDGAGVGVVEVEEVDKISQEHGEIAAVTDKAFDPVDAIELGFEGLVLSKHGVDRTLGIGGQNRSNALGSQAGDGIT